MYSGLSAGLASVFLQFSAFFTINLSRQLFDEKINQAQPMGMHGSRPLSTGANRNR
jgi:O-acetylserine/cysteine efflux transporter